MVPWFPYCVPLRHVFPKPSQVIRKIRGVFALCAVISSLTACGGADTPAAPSAAAAPATGIVQGIVRHEAYVSHGYFPKGQLLARK